MGDVAERQSCTEVAGQVTADNGASAVTTHDAHRTTRSVLLDLHARCARAHELLFELHDDSTDLDERSRLRGKAAGVALVSSYIEEELRNG